MTRRERLGDIALLLIAAACIAGIAIAWRFG